MQGDSARRRYKERRHATAMPPKNRNFKKPSLYPANRGNSNSDRCTDVDDLTILASEAVTIKKINISNPNSSVFGR